MQKCAQFDAPIRYTDNIKHKGVREMDVYRDWAEELWPQDPPPRRKPSRREWRLLPGIAVLWAVTLYLLLWPSSATEQTQPVFTDPADQGASVQADTAVISTAPEDTAAPRILGILDRTIYEGDTISYFQGIEVVDDLDPQPVLEVSSTNVDVMKAGIYFVTYTARDNAGNEKSMGATVTVEKRPEETTA